MNGKRNVFQNNENFPKQLNIRI